MKLTARITITAVVPLILILAVVVVQLNRSIAYTNDAIEREDQLKHSLVRNNAATLLRQLTSAAAILARSGDTARAVQSNDVSFLYEWSRLFHSQFVSKVVFTDTRGIVLSRSDNQFMFSDEIGDTAPVSDALNGSTARGFYRIDGELHLAVAKQVLVYDEIPVGSIIVSIALSDALMERLAQGSGAGICIVFDDVDFCTHRHGANLRGKSPIQFSYDPGSISPVEAAVLFFADEHVERLQALQRRFVQLIAVLSLALPAVLFWMLRSYLRPYTILLNGLSKLPNGRETFPFVRSLFKASLTDRSHEASVIAEAVSAFTISMEENLTMLERLSTTDQLTQLKNRRHLETVLLEEIERVSRYPGTFSVLIADIDNFKRINDDLGHQEGDRMLCTIANVMTQTCRATDAVGRWGGEEFILLCRQTGVDGAVDLAEKLRRAVENETESDRWRGAPVGTLSIGVGTFRAGDTAESLLRRADAALYRAKQSGRNRVESGDR